MIQIRIIEAATKQIATNALLDVVVILKAITEIDTIREDKDSVEKLESIIDDIEEVYGNIE